MWTLQIAPHQDDGRWGRESAQVGRRCLRHEVTTLRRAWPLPANGRLSVSAANTYRETQPKNPKDSFNNGHRQVVAPEQATNRTRMFIGCTKRPGTLNGHQAQAPRRAEKLSRRVPHPAIRTRSNTRPLCQLMSPLLFTLRSINPCG